MQTLEFHLDEFEGPLDLLLTLIQKHKLDIYDIAIVELVDQYMNAIGHVREETMEVASSFMEMAARLVYIKSLTLLPKHEEEVEELRKELQGELLEYQLVQGVAEFLRENYVGQQVVVRKPLEIENHEPYEVRHKVETLLEAYLLSIGRKRDRLPPSQESFSGIVRKPVVSVESRVVFVLHSLYDGHEMTFDHFFANADTQSEKVATFLAILELVRNKRIEVVGTEDQLHVILRSNLENEEELDESERN